MEENFCTTEEQNQRLEICKTCSWFWISEENMTYCLEANKSIGFQISEVNAVCPLEKW